MPWLWIILAAIFLTGGIWFGFRLCETIWSKILWTLVIGALIIVLTGLITLMCVSIAAQYGASRSLDEPTEIIEIIDFYILDEKFVVLTKNGDTLEYPYSNGCFTIQAVENFEDQRIILYKNCTWDSPVRQFLYGTPPTFYEIYRTVD